jgi:hypothetical protein
MQLLAQMVKSVVVVDVTVVVVVVVDVGSALNQMVMHQLLLLLR